MTAPTNYNTPRGIIERAMRDCGLLGKGRSPSSVDYADGLNRLNDIVNITQTQGVKLWLQQDYSFQPTQGFSLYVLAPTNLSPWTGAILQAMTKPTRLLELDCYFQDNTGLIRPLIPISRNEYNTLGARQTNYNVEDTQYQGAIVNLYVDKQENYLGVYLWQTPDAWSAKGYVHLILQNQVTNYVQLTDSMGFPIEWTMYMHWALSAELSTGQPQAVIDRCEQKAGVYREALEAWDTENVPVYLQPDTRNQYQGSRFLRR